MGTKLNREYRKNWVYDCKAGKEINQLEQQATQVEEFISEHKWYSEIDELTFAILNAPVNNEVLMETPEKRIDKIFCELYPYEDIVALEHFKPIVVERRDKETT